MATLALLSVSLFLLLSTHPSYAAVFDITTGNVTALIAAINTANTNGEKNTINLEPGTYRLTAVDNVTGTAAFKAGPDFLPSPGS